MSFRFANYPNGNIPPELPNDFTITVGPNTDLWEKPPSTHSFSCPILYREIKLAAFQKARVAVTAQWKDLYDQGGLCIIIHKADGSRQWVKTGVEFVDHAPHVSTVATDRWSDWSLRPMPSMGSSGAIIEMAREKDGSLWVYLLEGVKRSPLREVTWFFEGEGEGEDNCWVGVYGAKPSETGDIEVSFSNLVIESR
jgi:uncharacterized protein